MRKKDDREMTRKDELDAVVCSKKRGGGWERRGTTTA
jgi:hypothetical protein